jgi:hypothetical protein
MWIGFAGRSVVSEIVRQGLEHQASADVEDGFVACSSDGCLVGNMKPESDAIVLRSWGPKANTESRGNIRADPLKSHRLSWPR